VQLTAVFDGLNQNRNGLTSVGAGDIAALRKQEP
jgi:hypothetical protein